MDVGMTPTDLETFVRQRYNAVGDTFFPQTEIFNFFYKAQVELSIEFDCIERVYTTTTVADQREYDWPERALKIARITYDGDKLDPNDFLSDDVFTGDNENETMTGRPEYYQQWGDALYLRPVPGTNEAGVTLKLYTYDMPSVPSSLGTLDVPAVYHPFLADYALWAMCMQDQNPAIADRFLNAWKESKKIVSSLEREKLVADRFVVVRDMDTLNRESRLYR
jgi:hypothetical protein